MESSESLTYGWGIVLGLIQGLTEFLPISSSGHLALAQHFGLKQPLPILLDILLHAATLLVVIGAFVKQFWRYTREDLSVLGYTLVGTLPVVVAGLLLKSRIEALRDVPLAIAIALLVTALAIVLMERCGSSTRNITGLGFQRALLIGAAQAVAVVPGVSRSGVTLAASRLCSLDRKQAIEFSFFLMVPAVGGAALLSVMEALCTPGSFSQLPAGPCCVAFFTALVSGYAALRLLITLMTTRHMMGFAIYCAGLSACTLLYFVQV